MSAHFLAPMLDAPARRWRLVHEASGATVAGTLHAAFDSAARRTGLLGKDGWPAGEGLVIAPCQAVHTIGMRFAIDVLYVRRDGTVEKVSRAVKPWRLSGAWRAFAVIEVAAGVCDACAPAMVPGDRVAVVPGD